MLLGWDKEKAFEFSFIASIPAIFGATLLEAKKIALSQSSLLYLSGVVFSFITALFALKALLKIVKNDKFYLFGIYCLVVSLVGILIILS